MTSSPVCEIVRIGRHTWKDDCKIQQDHGFEYYDDLLVCVRGAEDWIDYSPESSGWVKSYTARIAELLYRQGQAHYIRGIFYDYSPTLIARCHAILKYAQDLPNTVDCIDDLRPSTVTDPLIVRSGRFDH